jgi:hypothetical protein
VRQVEANSGGATDPDGPVLTFTLDLEDHRPSPTWPVRYPELTRQWLDHCEERGIRGTVFVVGRVAERSPALVREVAERGHEVGLHNFDHWALFSCRPAWFRRRVADAKALVEDLIGAPVRGFRGPAGTLVPSTYWTTEVLVDVGFSYSATAVPAQTYGVGFPGCPTTPFRWASGLAELPCPIVQRNGVGLPFLGGTFLRVLPLALVRRFAARLPAGSVPWVYAHPYDIDALEPIWRVPEVGWWGSVLLWVNRGHMLAKLDALGFGWGAPLGERLALLADSLQVIDPADLATPRASEGPVAGLAGVLRREGRVRQMTVPGGAGVLRTSGLSGAERPSVGSPRSIDLDDVVVASAS